MESATCIREIAAATAPLYAKIASVVPEIEWAVFAPDVAAINALKRKKNAVILAHNYMTPEIFHCVADFVGDSLQLAREAAKTDAKIIVQASVHFMAETSKILSPEKTVLIPDPRAGCSLAASITAEDIRQLRKKYPGLPIVAYVNTSAEVKAEADICCTSANAVDIVEAIAEFHYVDTVIMVPDEYLARNVAGRHPRLHPELCRARRDLEACRPGAHPAGRRPKRVVLLTECSMSDNVAVEYPDVSFVRPCNLCPHMKRITLAKIRHALETETVEVTVDTLTAERARASLEAMLKVGLRTRWIRQAA